MLHFQIVGLFEEVADRLAALERAQAQNDYASLLRVLTERVSRLEGQIEGLRKTTEPAVRAHKIIGGVLNKAAK